MTTYNDLVREYKIEMQTELDCFDFRMNNLAVDIEELEAQTLDACNKLTEQIARLESLHDYFANKLDTNEDKFNLLKLSKEFLKDCFEIFERYNYVY